MVLVLSVIVLDEELLSITAFMYLVGINPETPPPVVKDHPLPTGKLSDLPTQYRDDGIAALNVIPVLLPQSYIVDIADKFQEDEPEPVILLKEQ